LFVKHIDPPTIRVRAYKLVDVDLPVKVRVENRLPDRLYIKRIAVENSVIRAAVPLYRKDEYSAIYTEPIDLSEITGTTTMRLKLISPELVQLPDNGSSSVKVTIEIMDKKAKR